MKRLSVWGLVVLAAATVTAQEQGHRKVADEVYATRGTLQLKADVYIPHSAGPHPGVLVVHGGAWRSGTKVQLARVAEHLADNGFTAVAINYRLAPAHKYPAQIEDCREAVRWMRDKAKDYKIDAARIGGYGYSAGGHLVAMLAVGPTSRDDAAQSAAERLQAAVCGGAPCNFQTLPSNSRALAYWLGGTRGEQPDQYADASPILRVSRETPPVFLFHGEDDNLVELHQPKAMLAALEKAGATAELHVVPRTGHVAAAMSQKAQAEAARFLRTHLQPAGETARGAADSP
jgi:acetyl esterase/lipase